MSDQPDQNGTILQAILSLTKTVSDVQTELAVNTTETKNIVTRLDKLNGSVAKHDTAISLNEQAIALLTQTLTRQTQSDETKHQRADNWLDWFFKGLVILALVILYTLLVHSKILLPLTFP